MPASSLRLTDLNARRAAIAMGVATPADTLLYLLLPMFAAEFGVTLVQAGLLLAANRIVRIVGYGRVARFYAERGDAPTCTIAVIAASCCGLIYATASGFWMLLIARLVWGLCFGALNLSTQALATADLVGSGHRTGKSRAVIALGSMLALPLGAAMTMWAGPRPIFFVLSAFALSGLFFTRYLPVRAAKAPKPLPMRRFGKPNSLDLWSFMEGVALDGLFIIGLSVFAQSAMQEHAVLAAGALMALRYVAEILLGPLGGAIADRLSPERMLVWLSLASAVALIGFGAGWFWSAAVIMVLRALQLPLMPPIVARRYPGPGRVEALVARSLWRDIGGGVGPLLAGLLLPITPALLLYGGAAILVAAAALATTRDKPPVLPTESD
ncbi:MFS transporter [Pigmentiphaga aceris]|uniref:MFS transporter n=1 Tax=Pigmentiphaga aceris TaxID=1940612 RepID=A0A5C0ASD8_9BURK|nr:MFS transporter [Pigmentiphaga aceris]QEI04905.1 MFS transporter [Pigmentiphaga aceris]